MPVHQQTRPQQRASRAPWRGSLDKNGNPVIKGVTELQSAAATQDARAKGSLYGDVPDAAQVMQNENERMAADALKRTAAFSAGYERMRRNMGAGAQPEQQVTGPASPAERRRNNLIAGGAQPLEADAAIAQEAAAQKPAATPTQAPTAPTSTTKATGVTGGMPQPAATPPPPMGIGADANLTNTALAMQAPPVTQITPPQPVSTVNDGGATMPFKDWIRAKREQQNGDVPQVAVAAKGGRPKGGPVLAGEEGDEVKVNDDESVEQIHGPQVLEGGKPGVIIPHKELMKMAAKHDKPIKKSMMKGGMKCAANGGRVMTSADGLIGDANAMAPVGIGGVTNVMPAAPPAQGGTGGGGVVNTMAIGKPWGNPAWGPAVQPTPGRNIMRRF